MRVLRTALVVPMMITPIVGAQCRKLLLEPSLGFFNYLIFDALALNRFSSNPLGNGKLIYGSQYRILTVPLAKLLENARHSVVQLIKQQKTGVKPPLMLNKHCPECVFHARCRQAAVEKDDLSLLTNMTAKERQKLNDKGIFTVTQLSYTFRPRRRRRFKGSQTFKHEPALKALAIRKDLVQLNGPSVVDIAFRIRSCASQ